MATKGMTKAEFNKKAKRYKELKKQQRALEAEAKLLKAELAPYIKLHGEVDHSMNSEPYKIEGTGFTAYLRDQIKESVDIGLLKSKLKSYKKYMRYTDYDVLDIR